MSVTSVLQSGFVDDLSRVVGVLPYIPKDLLYIQYSAVEGDVGIYTTPSGVCAYIHNVIINVHNIGTSLRVCIKDDDNNIVAVLYSVSAADDVKQASSPLSFCIPLMLPTSWYISVEGVGSSVSADVFVYGNVVNI